MNTIEVLKDKLKKMDRFHRQQLLVYFMLFGFMIGETYVLIKLTMVANQYSQELITLDEFIDLQNQVLIFAFVYMVFLVLGMVLMYFWIKLLQVEYEKEQQILDSIKSIIKVGNDHFEYLIQCDPDNATLVKSPKGLLSLIINSELFSTLYWSYKNGATSFSIDESNIFKEKFEIEVKELAPKMKTITEEVKSNV